MLSSGSRGMAAAAIVMEGCTMIQLWEAVGDLAEELLLRGDASNRSDLLHSLPDTAAVQRKDASLLAVEVYQAVEL